MLFCSQQFLVFFLLVLAIYWSLPSQRPRVWLLLSASIYFYASWNLWLTGIIAASSALDYLIGRGLEASDSRRVRRSLLVTSLVVNLSILFYFKYANFFLSSLEVSLRAAGASASFPVLSVILPIGISFYTFEAISYTVDVYQRRIHAERSFASFLLFILFFPHLVAGPVVRARDFLPQVCRPKRWSWPRFHLGGQYFLMGLFKKLVIADHMALFADPVFANPQQYGTGAIWLATIAYSLQIYGDFSGYSDMALGAAHMLGYKLAVNFNMPYLAPNIADFWRRWHISLSSWLRDYLFIPLGGSRGGQWLIFRNLLITMTLGGLWHGASWTFVLWGVLHGILLIGHRLFRQFCDPRPALGQMLQSSAGTALRIALTFLSVAFGWILFRATSFDAAWAVLSRLGWGHEGLDAPLNTNTFWWVVAAVIACHFAASRDWWRRIYRRAPAPLTGFAYALTLNVVFLLAPGASKMFIYFQF